MNLFNKIFSAFFETYFSFEGRFSRTNYVIALFGMYFFSIFLFVLADEVDYPIVWIIVGVIIAYLLFFGMLAISTKRFHDIGYSGYACLWMLILGGLVNIYLIFMPGDKLENKYGKNIHGDKTKDIKSDKTLIKKLKTKN